MDELAVCAWAVVVALAVYVVGAEMPPPLASCWSTGSVIQAGQCGV